MKRCVPLEAAAEAVCDQSAVPPLIFQLPPEQGREVLEKAQDSPVYMYPADISNQEVDTGKWGTIPVYFIAPRDAAPKRVIFYIHGAGWVFGSFHTHEKLVRELAARTDSLVVFPEYTRSPEAKYPTAIEQCYFILAHLWELIGDHWSGIDHDTLTIAGDSVGGNMTIAMALMAKQRKGPKILNDPTQSEQIAVSCSDGVGLLFACSPCVSRTTGFFDSGSHVSLGNSKQFKIREKNV